MEDNELIAGGVYAKKGDPDNKQSIMSTFKQRGESAFGLLFEDGGRIPIRKNRGGVIDDLSKFDLVARPLPIKMFQAIAKIVDLVDDIVEIVELHRKKKAK